MMLNPAGFSFRIQEEKIYLLRQEKQQEFINSKPILKEISKDLYVKKKEKNRKGYNKIKYTGREKSH